MEKKSRPQEIVNLLKEIGSIIRRIRLTKNFRQSDIINATGLSQNVITNLEIGNGSSLTTFILILEHLKLTETVFTALEVEALVANDSRKRCSLKIVQKRKPTLVVEQYEGVSKRELKSAENENIKLSRALDEADFFTALNQHPDRVFRISVEFALKLIGDLTSSIAVLTKNRSQKTLDGIHVYTVYYATSLEKAVVLDLSWLVGGFTMTMSKRSDLPG